MRNRLGGPGYWVEYDARGELVGVVGDTLVHSTPRDHLSPERVKEWTKPETYPVADPPAPSPGFTPSPPLTRPEGVTVAPPLPPPEGFARPELDVPLYVEAEWEWHHHLPQRWWNPERKEPYPFSEKAIKYFDSQIVRVPRGEHWGRLHNTYNKVVGALLGTYLNQEAEKAGKTLKKYLSDMGAEDAAACLEEIKWIIRNSGPDASDEVKDAKTFLEKMESYEPKEPNR